MDTDSLVVFKVKKQSLDIGRLTSSQGGEPQQGGSQLLASYTVMFRTPQSTFL